MKFQEYLKKRPSEPSADQKYDDYLIIRRAFIQKFLAQDERYQRFMEQLCVAIGVCSFFLGVCVGFFL